MYFYLYITSDITMLEECHNFHPQGILYQQNDTAQYQRASITKLN